MLPLSLMLPLIMHMKGPPTNDTDEHARENKWQCHSCPELLSDSVLAGAYYEESESAGQVG